MLGMPKSIDRLACISRVLMDQRVLDQRKEIEQLQEENRRLHLQLFWKDHELSSLESLMMDLNIATPWSSHCDCYGCCVAGRYPANPIILPPNRMELEPPCQFGLMFEAKLNELGMTFHAKDLKPGESMRDPKVLRIETCDPRNGVYDEDYHFVNLTGKNWFNIFYGKKLWGAKDVNDLEIQKLIKLFKWMRSGGEIMMSDEEDDHHID